MSRPPFPPFDANTAAQKARMAEDAWNTRDPARVAQAYTADSRWRNRAEFLQGRDAIEAFLTRKWAKELDYRLIKEVWAFRDNRIAATVAAPALMSHPRFVASTVQLLDMSPPSFVPRASRFLQSGVGESM